MLERNNMEAENSTESSTKLGSYKKNCMEVQNVAETSTKAESLKKRIPKSLKAKSKLVKKSSARSLLKDKKAKGSPPFQRRYRKKKNKSGLKVTIETPKNELEGAGELNSGEEIVQKNAANEKHIEKGQERIESSNKSQQNQRNKEKHHDADKAMSNQKGKRKLDGKEKSERDGKEKSEKDEKKKEKLGGLIFMCSAKTKPDCFHYRVMGVNAGKKDLVLGVKPGLKLFLYDFDLKLMYGIYQASSSGGMRLEPKAFGGSFPVQVRFSVYKDCFPLPESVFKKAIKDNYDKNNKFKIELTVRQVRKLSELFRPATFQSAQPAVVPPPQSSPRAGIQDREVYQGLRKLRPHSENEVFARTNGDGSSYSLLPQERDRHIEYQEMVSTQREKVPRDLFMSEQEYRTYGLQGERRNLTPQHNIVSTLDPYQRDEGRKHLLRQPVQIYRDIMPIQGESVLVDPLYTSQREFIHNPRHELAPAAPLLTASASVSSVAAIDSYARDPYATYRYSASTADTYLPSLRREGVSSGSYYVDGRTASYLAAADSSHRIEVDHGDKLYSTYAFDALSNYNQVQQSYGAKQENAPPVSSRYSFAGPSMSYR